MEINKKERGFLLVFWLFLILIFNIFVFFVVSTTSVIVTILGKSLVGSKLILFPSWWVFGFLSLGFLANSIFIIFIFLWKKWSFYAYCISTLIVLIVYGISNVLNIRIFLALLIGPLVLYLLIKSRWHLFN